MNKDGIEYKQLPGGLYAFQDQEGNVKGMEGFFQDVAKCLPKIVHLTPEEKERKKEQDFEEFVKWSKEQMEENR